MNGAQPSTRWFQGSCSCASYPSLVIDAPLLLLSCRFSYRHEIVGEVTEVGNKVEKFKVGDKVGVGCLVGSCGNCNSCDKSFENNCAKWILTYGAIDHDGTITYGGYSDTLVAPERFVVRFPDNLPLDKGAPLLCAGVTVYSPMKHFGLNEPGKHLGVVGLGGLGHVAIRFAKAFGAKVTVVSTSPSKEREAIDNFGADAFLLSNNPAQMKVGRPFKFFF